MEEKIPFIAVFFRGFKHVLIAYASNHTQVTQNIPGQSGTEN